MSEHEAISLQKEKTYYLEADTLKGLAMFLVILGHAIIWYPVNLHEDPACLWLFNLVSSVHVLLFFCLSGFLLSYKGNYRAYLWKKVLRLGIPYVIFNLIDMVPRSLFAALFNRPRSVSESLLSMVFNGGELWFLRALFLFYVVFAPLALLQSRGVKWKVTVEVALFLLAAMPGVDTEWYQYLDLNRIKLCLFFFNTGFLLKGPYPSVKERMERARPISIGFLSFILTVVWVGSVSFLHLPWWPGRIISIATSLIAVAACYTYTAWKPFNTFFARFGPWTLQLYLMNSWTMGASRYFICTIMGVTAPAVIVLFNMLVDFFLSYLIIKYVFARFRVLRFAMGISPSVKD